MRRSATALFIAACLTAAVVTRAQAGGLWLYEQGTPDQGTAAAGRAALGQDAATAWGNPAGMTRLDTTQYTLGAGALVIQSEFETEPGTTKSGGGSDLTSVLPLLSGHFVYSVSRDLKLGASLTPLMGGIFDYGDTYAGRYFIQREAIMTLAFTPVAAYRVTDWLSVGGGFSVVGGYLSGKEALNNPNPALRDARLELYSMTVGFGGNVGVMLEPWKGTRFGVTYRTPVNLTFHDVIQSVRGLGPGVSFILNVLGQRLDVPRGSAVDLTLTNPQEVMFSAYQDVTDKFAVMANFGWQNWQAFGHVGTTIHGDTDIEKTLSLHFNDTYHYAVGAQYRVAPPWLVTAGFAYDTSPVAQGRRTVVLPLDRQIRYAAGVQYDVAKDLALGAAYTLIDGGSAPFNMNSGELRGDLVGHYKPNFIHAIGVNINKRF